MSDSVSKFISKLDKLNDVGIEVFVPSKERAVTTAPLNLKQQKDLISSVLDGVKGTLDFTRTLNNIILDNSGIDDLKIFDKLPFTIGMRVQALGTTYVTSESEVDLQVVLDNIKATKLQFKEDKLIEYKNLKINLAVPTLREENALLKKGASDLGSNNENYKESVGALYMLEIVKYVKELEIDGVVVNMPDIKIVDRMELVEKLPLAVYTDISDYIETVTSYNTNLLTVGDNKVSIDALFFDSGSAE
tara:strand:- start:392 stop:1132 length:741 start_codon:yes stop_codon:yes gene_type:complete